MKYEDIVKGLSNVKGVRSYTDKEGKFHLTTKTIEQEEREREEELTREKGSICSICNKRKKDCRIDINKDKMCKSCYDKCWEEYSIYDEDITVNMICPICNKESIINLESKGSCECGTIYSAGFKDEFYYGIDFYKRKKFGVI